MPKHPFRIAVLFASALLLAACAGRDEYAAPVAVQPTTVPGLALSETGVGLVDQSTRFSSSAISEALGGARVETVNATYQGRVIAQLAAFGPSGLQMARFQGSGGRITGAQIVSEDVPGPGGARVGMSYRQTGGNSMQCDEGTGSWEQMAVCRRAGSAITYVYSVPLWREGRMPRGNELNDAVLNRMIWEP
ncbi:MAG: DUF1131 family protein [Hyphomicrobiales bacterium]